MKTKTLNLIAVAACCAAMTVSQKTFSFFCDTTVFYAPIGELRP